MSRKKSADFCSADFINRARSKKLPDALEPSAGFACPADSSFLKVM
jgi:hypothetical protein